MEYMLILVFSEVVLLRHLVNIHEATVAGSLVQKALVLDKSQVKHTMFPNTIMILC